jgi:hypothetical protein
MPLDLRFQGFSAVSDDEINQVTQANNIRSDAVIVKTTIGGAVWLDPSDSDLISRYRSGMLRGDENFFSTSIYHRLMPRSPTILPVIIQGQTEENLQVIPNGKFLQIRIGVFEAPKQTQEFLRVNVSVTPTITEFEIKEKTEPWQLTIVPIPLNLTDVITKVARDLTHGKINSYFDQARVGKTLLNFGSDFQGLLTNWKYDSSDPNGYSTFVKLYTPLPDEFSELSEVWISRELSPSYIDQLNVVFIPNEGTKVYLRPPNKQINVRNLSGNQVYDVTLQSLLTTGSLSTTNLQDPVLQKWYITSLEGAELNINYNDFSDFVFYSSATERVSAFKQKLLLLEDYNTILSQQSASIASSISASNANFTSSTAFAGYQRISEQRLDLIRSFDGYERFLYYSSGSAYSSSFSDDSVDQLYYLKDATWPKIQGNVISVASASNASLYSISASDFIPKGDLSSSISWLSAISFIADEYDRQNQNRLANNVPEYLKNDTESTSFIKFIDLIGHHFDVLKIYADQMPNIYDRDNDPAKGLSADLVWNIASSFGIELPNQYAVENLINYTIGELGTVNPTVYREAAAETWKRFLHNQIYLLKTKGTKNALRGLLNAYGVLPTTVQIRESSTPSFYTTQSFEVIEEQTNTLDSSGSYVAIPFSGSGLPSPQTVQTRFATTVVTQSVLFNVGNQWAIQLLPVSASYGKLYLISGSTNVASSSALTLYSGNYFNVTIQQSGSQALMWAYRADEDGDIVESSTATGSLNNWLSGSTLYLGSSGSTLGSRFDGNFDEFRLWSEALTENIIQFHTRYPGLYNGNTKDSAKYNLPVRLSFGRPVNLGTTPFVPNESPYLRHVSASAVLTQFSASGFQNEPTYPYSMEVVTRNVLRYAPNTGGSQFSTNKIVVVDPPVLRYLSNDSGSSVPVLAHDQSIVSLDTKQDKIRSNNVVGFYFSITDAINDSIIRSIGNIDLQDFIGDPSDLYADTYSDLKELNDLYWTSYAYAYNYNSFVDFVSNLLHPLFEQARKMVPARAKLLTGIVLESPILERNKIKWTPIETSGIGTLDTQSNPTLEANSLEPQPDTFDGAYPTYDAPLASQEANPVDGTFDTFNSSLDTISFDTLTSSYDFLTGTKDLTTESPINAEPSMVDGSVDATDEDSISSYFLTIDDETSRLDYLTYLLQRFNAVSLIQVRDNDKPYFNQLLTTFKPGATTKISTGTNEDFGTNIFEDFIEPNVDFLSVTDTNYFDLITGLYATIIDTQERVGVSSMVSRGSWVKGSVYSAKDYVTQVGATGSAEIGNGKEFVCVTPLASGSFISYNPPYLDFDNWRKVQYRALSTVRPNTISQRAGDFQVTPLNTKILNYYPGQIGVWNGNYSRASIAKLVSYSASVYSASVNVPREIHYILFSGSLVQTTLLEDARINSWSFSNQFDSASWANKVQVTASLTTETTAPDNSLTAWKLTEPSGSVVVPRLNRTITGSTFNVSQSVSWHVKAAETFRGLYGD